MEAPFLLKPCDALRAREEAEPQWTLDGDLAETEVGRREDAAHDDLLLAAVLGDDAGITIPVVDEELKDVLRLLRGYLAALVPKAPTHLYPKGRCVDKLNHSPALRGLAIREEPNIGGDAGVVEELLRQGYQCLQ